eukprot:TRINITY_DN4525_c0_g1_i1.p1 TRINITY_DN4525_c0_g1~~TRINITY_DN4525_c0_g1_i1.p1  ORF type:complete len:319 (+),score=87.72 TRINITY_DN4525_c0_g1_i1:32-988(+)
MSCTGDCSNCSLAGNCSKQNNGCTPDKCATCPSRGSCGAAQSQQIDPVMLTIKEKMSTIPNKILVLSGKGGVGKSTVATMLADQLSRIGHQVGLLDVDICGPSIPTITGCVDSDVIPSALGWTPIIPESYPNLSVMSIGFLLQDRDAPVIWRGPKKNSIIQSFLAEVDWTGIDTLIIDTPPGTSDEHLAIYSYLSQTDLSGAVIVTTPQEVAMADVRKEINFCRKTNIPILGLVENMSGFVCPSCAKVTHIFTAKNGRGPKDMATNMSVPYLGSFPLDPRIMAAMDAGENFAESAIDSPALGILKEVVEKLLSIINSE